MLMLHNITYIHPDKSPLFQNIHFTAGRREKIALIGNNGAGKSKLLQVMAGELQPSGGYINHSAPPYLIPQNFGQYDHQTIAEVLHIDRKLKALNAILNGEVTEENMTELNDDWTIGERSMEALNKWQLQEVPLSQKLGMLSGGQKTRTFLAGLTLHQPELILMDEPSNHLDLEGRAVLYDFIRQTAATLIIASHDRELLQLLTTVCELGEKGITVYGGDYNFYREQKQVEANALDHDIQAKEKALRKAKEKERETTERQQKLDARGKSKQEKSGVARIMMNTLRNHAENSTSRLKSVHAEKTGELSKDLHRLRTSLPEADKMKLGFTDSTLHKGKVLVAATAVNFRYTGKSIWKEGISFRITSGERVLLKGLNGSGKTTLIKLILGINEPSTGTIYRSVTKAVYIDQDYSLIDNRLTVYEQAQRFNTSALQEHEIKIRLTRFLFTKESWDKPCNALSGGERMRLLLCCLNIQSQAPELIILDEPTNNLDIQNVEILTNAISEYKGTLLVVSHDRIFLKELGVQREIDLE